MRPEIFWVANDRPGKLAIMPRPRGGDWLGDEIESLEACGVNVLVSLLTEDETTELELVEEPGHCGERGVQFLSFPIPDRGIAPSVEQFRELVLQLDNSLSTGSNVAVHCRMGIGRSAMIAACLLVRQGVSVEEAFARITDSRGFEVPDTQEQINWVASLAADLQP